MDARTIIDFAPVFAHWFIAIFLATFGVLALVMRSRFLSVEPYVKNLELPPELRARCDAAVQAREEIDSSGHVARAVGVVALVCAGLEWTPLPAVIPYALFTVGLAVCMLLFFVFELRPLSKRVAVLEARNVAKVAPWFVMTAATVEALCPLGAIGVPGYRVSGIAVCLSSLLMLYVGSRLVYLPARLLGNDLPAERFIDTRIRSMRAGTVLTMLGAPVMVLLALSMVSMAGSTSIDYFAVIVSLGIAAIAQMVVGIWLIRLNAKPRETELAELAMRA